MTKRNRSNRPFSFSSYSISSITYSNVYADAWLISGYGIGRGLLAYYWLLFRRFKAGPTLIIGNAPSSASTIVLKRLWSYLGWGLICLVEFLEISLGLKELLLKKSVKLAILPKLITLCMTFKLLSSSVLTKILGSSVKLALFGILFGVPLNHAM